MGWDSEKPSVCRASTHLMRCASSGVIGPASAICDGLGVGMSAWCGERGRGEMSFGPPQRGRENGRSPTRKANRCGSGGRGRRRSGCYDRRLVPSRALAAGRCCTRATFGRRIVPRCPVVLRVFAARCGVPARARSSCATWGLVKAARCCVESPRRCVESPRRCVESPRRCVESPRRLIESPRSRIKSSGGRIEPRRSLLETPRSRLEATGRLIEATGRRVEATWGRFETTGCLFKATRRCVEPAWRCVEAPWGRFKSAGRRVETPRSRVEPPRRRVETPGGSVEAARRRVEASGRCVTVPITAFRSRRTIASVIPAPALLRRFVLRGGRWRRRRRRFVAAPIRLLCLALLLNLAQQLLECREPSRRGRNTGASAGVVSVGSKTSATTSQHRPALRSRVVVAS